MLRAWCAGHEAEVLVWAGGIEAIIETDTGLTVQYRCSCGTRGSLRTGRRKDPAATGTPAAEPVTHPGELKAPCVGA